MFKIIFIKIQYIIIRIIEAYPQINLLILNNLIYFKFFLPHDKDYLGLKLIFKKNYNLNSFLDIGANVGASALSFIKMGFYNKMYLFEPNFNLYNNYLKKIKKKHHNLKIYNYALGSKNKSLIFFLPYIEKIFIHYFSSFNKKYIINSCSNTFPNKKIILKKKIVKVKKFDDLKIKDVIDFIKIDSEGYDLEIIKGLNKTLNKFKPALLIEYNKDLYLKIVKKLNKYCQFYYNIKKNSLVQINNSNFKKLDRFGHKDLLSIRNVYFIHKDKMGLLNC
jgi:FkbM family methyltransferase